MNILTNNRLNVLAERIRTDIDRRAHSRDEWVTYTLDLAAALLEAREHFKADIAFGRWCDENQFDLNKNDRSAYIAFGREPERARLVLEQSKSNSVKQILEKEFRVPRAGKPQKPKIDKEAPKTQAALDAYDAFRQAGIDPTREQVATKAGVSEMPARRAIDKRKAEEALSQQGADVSDLPKTAREKAEAAVRKIRKQMESEFDQRLQAAIRKHITEFVLPMYAEKLELADRILATNKKPFTIEEYRKLLGALHPDSSSVERRTEMFRIVKEREALLRPADKDKPLSGDLPKTIEELLKRRKNR